MSDTDMNALRLVLASYKKLVASCGDAQLREMLVWSSTSMCAKYIGCYDISKSVRRIVMTYKSR